MNITIRPMTIADYDGVYRLWSVTEGLSLIDDDNREGIARYLQRNVGLCFVGVDGKEIVGTVLCGHDGRRGILRHLAVAGNYRKQGIARRLVRACLDALAAAGVTKCNIYVMDYHADGFRFWEHLGAKLQNYDWRTFQLPTTP